MALKKLMLRRKIDAKKEQLEELRKKDAEFQTREAELETAIGEAETEEEQKAVEEEVEKFDEEKETHETAKNDLAGEIEGLEAELEEAEAAEPEDRSGKAGTHRSAERKERMGRGQLPAPFAGATIRSLPKNVRALYALPMETRDQIMGDEEVKDFLQRLRSMKNETRSVSGAELNIPVVMLDIIAENATRYSKLIEHVRTAQVAGEGRQTIVGTIPEGVWTEMCGAINELSFEFNQVTTDGYKVAGFIPVCNSMLEDATDVNLAAEIIEMISAAIGYAKDKAILYGKGAASKMPLGIVTRLAQTMKPSGYPDAAPTWEDLHQSNIVKFDGDSLSAVEFWAKLIVVTAAMHTRYNRGEIFWAMSSKTKRMLQAKLVAFSAEGKLTADLQEQLPIITGTIEELEFMADGDIVGGYGELYLWAQRAGIKLTQSEHVQFLLDNTVFKGTERADGMPVIPGAFMAINIKNNEVTTAMTFAADTANDAKLQSLTIGAETLAPAFSPDVTEYAIAAASAAKGTVVATPVEGSASVEISYNGKNVGIGEEITWAKGTKPLTVTVRQGNAVRVYTVNVTKS